MLVDDNVSFILTAFIGFICIVLSLDRVRQTRADTEVYVPPIVNIFFPLIGLLFWIIFTYISSSLSSCSSSGLSLLNTACSSNATSSLAFPFEMLGVGMLAIQILILIVLIFMWSGKYFTLPAKHLEQ